MPEPQPLPTLCEAVEQSYRESFADWTRYHGKGRDLEELLTWDVKQVRMEVILNVHRRSLIVVSIHARRDHDSATYPFEFRESPYSVLIPPREV